MGEEKIIPIERIEEVVKEYRLANPGKKIVTTNGAFDIIHAGHIRSLNLAKGFGDLLIVGLNSDSSIRAYKSPLRPIIPQRERAILLASLEMVGYVVIFDETDPRRLLSLIKPDIHVKSRTGYKGIEGETIAKYGGRVELIDDIPGISTTYIIQKIKDIEKAEKGL